MNTDEGNNNGNHDENDNVEEEQEQDNNDGDDEVEAEEEELVLDISRSAEVLEDDSQRMLDANSRRFSIFADDEEEDDGDGDGGDGTLESFVIPDTFLSDSYLKSSAYTLPKFEEKDDDDDEDEEEDNDDDDDDKKPAAAGAASATTDDDDDNNVSQTSLGLEVANRAAKADALSSDLELFQVQQQTEVAAMEASRTFVVSQNQAAEADAAERELELFQAQQMALAAQDHLEMQRREMELQKASQQKLLQVKASSRKKNEAEEGEEEDVTAEKQTPEKEQIIEEKDELAPLRPSVVSAAGSTGTRSSISHLAVPLLQLLEDIVELHEDDVFATFYEADGKPSKTKTYGEIWSDAGILSYHLRYTWNVNKGEHVMLCLDMDSGLSYIAAWLGCLRAGAVPIVVASPTPPSFDIALTRMNLIMKAASPVVLILTDSVVAYWKDRDRADRTSSSRLMWPMDAPWQCVDKLPNSSGVGSGSSSGHHPSPRASIFQRAPETPSPKTTGRASFFWRPRASMIWAEDTPPSTPTSRVSFLWQGGLPGNTHDALNSFDERDLRPEDVACLQHTSGSTGDPKVVAITFEALFEAIQMTRHHLSFIFGDGVASEGLSWLPPDHHLGLFLTMLCPFASGCHMHYMSCVTFDQTPLQWLQLLSRYKIAWTAAPDPAYRWLMKHFDSLSAEKRNAMEIDLSSLRHLLNIGEASRFDTESKFRKLFGPYRLHKECSVTSGYSISEHILAVSWVAGEFVVVPSTLNLSPTNWVAVARRSTLSPDVHIIVVDPDSNEKVKTHGVVGEVWVHSPVIVALSKKGGYYKNRRLTHKMFQARLKGSKKQFLRTGDLGFWEIDHLYICGRRKDAMKGKKGTMYYPPDIEWVVEDARPEVRPGCVAVFSSVGKTVEVVFEVFASTSGETVKSVCASVAKAVTETTGIRASSIVAVPEGSIPKTHTGLVERRITKSKILKEQLTILYDFPERRDRVPVPNLETIIEERAIPDLKTILESRSKSRERIFGEKTFGNLQESEIDSILSRYIGSGFDSELSWDELGLTSNSSVPMKRDLETQMYVALNPNCLDIYPTPASLKEHILESTGDPLLTDALYLQLSRSSHFSWFFTGFLQAILSGFIIVLFSVPILPCWFVFEFLQTVEVMLLLMIPIWMITFSVIVLWAKWTVIGTYKQRRVSTPSFFYLRWWFCDRLVDLWEVWVGRFIIDTPMLWWFYTAMGAKLDPTCRLDGFLREFDLIYIGRYSSLKYFNLKCRKFSSWERFERGPLMAFRPIYIGDRCVIRGMVHPGVKIGDGVYVEKLSVVPEGADVENNVRLAGNPAFVADERESTDSPEYPCWFPVGVFKMTWVIAELGFLYGIWIGAEFINPTPEDVETVPIVYWIIFGATCILLSLLSSIVVKLLLVGVRRPGKKSRYWCYHPGDWAADYHFRLVTLPFRIFARNTRLCNIILMLHGMDIDFVSKVEMESFPPSKMDLISVYRSFIGTVTFDVKMDGIFHRTIVEKSSLGQYCHIGSDVTIAQTTIPPLSFVNETIIGDRMKKRHKMRHSFLLYGKELVTIVCDLVVLGAVLFTVVPAYLIWYLTLDILSPITIVPICAASLVAQTTSWFIVLWLVQLITFLGAWNDGKVRRPWFPCFHPVYMNCSDTYQTWSFFRVIYGSPIFRFLGWLLGTSFDGRILYFGERMYDCPFISVATRTVLDGVTVVGHNIVYDRTKFGHSRVSGLVRERTLVLADATIIRKESGPWHCITKNATSVKRKPTMLKPMITGV